MIDLLDERASRLSNQPLYTFVEDGSGDAGLPAGELRSRAIRIAAALRELASAGERAVLLYPPGLEYIAGFLGCLHAGLVAVPAYPPDPARLDRTLPRLLAIIEDARATVVLTTAFILPLSELLLEHAPHLGTLRWVATDALGPEGESTWRRPEVGPDSLAFLQYTSGSTGTPRGVMLSHRNLLHNLASISRCFGTRPDSTGVIWLPPYHDMGLIGGVLVPLFSGFHTALLSPLSFLKRPRLWLETLSRFGGTISGGPNFAFDLCVRRIPPDQRQGLELRRWEVAFCGAEPVRPETLARFAEAFAPAGFSRRAFYPCYGLAEGTLIVSGGERAEPPILKALDAAALERHRVLESAEDQPGARVLVGCGRSLPDQELAIVHPETRAPVAAGEVGEVLVRGPSVAGGYWHQPEETERTFGARIPGDGGGPYLRTGDLGFLLEGELFVTGRLKDLIILRGRNHYPQDVELTVERSHAGIRPGCAAAFAVERDAEERLVIVAELDARGGAEPGAVAAALRQAVERQHEVRVDQVVIIPAGSIPKTSSGKLQRRECRRRLLEGTLEVLARVDHAPAPETPEDEARAGTPEREALRSLPPGERDAVLLWTLRAEAARVLGLPPARLEPGAPLAGLGLDSVSAVELAGALEQRLGVALPLSAVLEGPSLETLARAAREALDAPPAAPAAAPSTTPPGDYPLSPGQWGLWFQQQLSPGAADYNIAAAVSVRAPLELECLGAALDVLVARHPALRTVFAATAGEPVQRVLPRGASPLRREDATSWDDARLRLRLDEEAARPFNLSAGPLFRVLALSRPNGEHVLAFTVHHIVSDLGSLAVLARELGIVHDRLRRGDATPLPPPESDSIQHAGWLRARLDSDGERLWSYWRQRLAGGIPSLVLPSFRPRPAARTSAGASRGFRVPPALSARLLSLARRSNATPYALLLSAFQVLLHRYTGQEELWISSPASGRTRPALAGAVGHLVNMLVMRGELSGDPTFAELLERTRRSVVGALEHQDFPFPWLVERLNASRDPGRPPLHEVAFVLQRPHLPEQEALGALALGEGGASLRLGELPVEALPLEKRTAPYELTLTLAEVGGQLAGTFQYDTAILDAPTVERLTGHFLNLLEGIAADPSRRLSALPLLSEEETRELARPSATRVRFDDDSPCLHHRFARMAAGRGDAEAASFGEERIGYRALDARANQLAHLLARRGVQRGDRVGLYVERSLDMVVAVLGILKAGATYVPMDTANPPERVRFMLEDSQARALVTRERHASVAPEGLPLVRLDSDAEALAAEPTSAPELAVSGEDIAYVIYTSGSTGKPKGVLVTHANVARLFDATWPSYRFGAEDVWTLFHSIAFDFSVWELWGALLYGGRLVVVPLATVRSPADFLELLRAERVTILNQTPSAFRQLIQAELARPDAPALALRSVIFGGEALPLESLRPWFDRHGDARPTLVNMYGITETTVHVTYRPLRARDLDEAPGSVIGAPLADLSVYVLDRHLQPVPIGVPGELTVGGAGVSRGYLNRPELTQARFVPDPFSGEPGARMYRSGDLARRLPSGELEYLGRMDDQVKVRGFRIELGEVESALARAPRVREAVVLAREGGGETQLVAYVVAKDGAAPSPGELRALLREQLPEYMVPAAFVLLPALPLTSSGKVDRRALPAPEDARAPGDTASAAPRTPTEQKLADAWARVFGVERVGVLDHFFDDLGGSSLRAVKVAAAAREALGREVPVVWIFEHPTVDALAARIDAETARAPAAPNPRTPGKESAADREIAIVGMAARFPGARNLEELWGNLRGGVESITRFPPESLEASTVYPEELRQHPAFVPAGGVLDGADRFDHGFFDISPREAQWMDPQQRLFLQCAWSALEDAGCDPDRFPGPISLYAGAGSSGLHTLALLGQVDRDPASLFEVLSTTPGESVATKASYKLRLSGESLNLYTACSTGLVAVHLACQSLRARGSDVALAGAVKLSLPQRTGYLFQEGMILSPDGHCRAFDQSARGTVPGNGVGVVVLKRLADAQRDGDRVYAVIKGSALNNDARAKISYTAPSVKGQAEVISRALDDAGVSAADIGYVEAHGTGTALGDPIEVSALTRAFRAHTDRQGYCALGSVKTNLGHLDTAAGMAGLIKVALALHHGELPPSLHFEQPNPEIDFAGSPFFVNTARRDWKPGGSPRRAGVSAFGIGGTNAHAILEEAPRAESAPDVRTHQPVTLAARTPAALDAMTQALAAFVEEHPGVPLADVAFTRNVGRRAFEHRRAVVAADAAELARLLRAKPRATEVPEARAGRSARVAFLFPGQGAQSPGMARELYALEPAFRREVDASLAVLGREGLEAELRAVLLAAPGEEASAAARLADPAVALPAILTVELALARLWMDWGLKPAALLGHSFGEYAAACVAGVLGREDALRLAVLRGRLIARMPPGAMLAVASSADRLAPLLGGALELAAVNGPERCVVSGPSGPLEALEQELIRRGDGVARLPVAYAFHSRAVEPLLPELERALAALKLSAPTLPYVSSLTGAWIRPEEAMDPRYWARQMREPVRFGAGLETLLSSGFDTLIEAGPDQGLTALARPFVRGRPLAVAVASLRRAGAQTPDHPVLLQSLTATWLAGQPVDWAAFHASARRRHVSLPTYPFDESPVPVVTHRLEPREAPPALREETPAPPPAGPAVAPVAPASVAPVASAARPLLAEIEHRLTALWRERLGVEQIHRDDNFLELGGNSLMAAQLLTRLREAFQIQLPLGDLFEAPTVAGLAARIEARLNAGQPLASAPRAESSLSRIDRGGELPLAFVQERLWRLERLDPGSSVFNEPLALRVSGALDLPLLERGANEVIRRHESLRTTFHPEGAGVRARIHPEARISLAVEDLRGFAGDREAEALRLARQEPLAPFSLEHGPLVRLRLLRLGEQEHVLLLTIHHIVADTLSLVNFIREAMAFYTAARQGAGLHLPELPVQSVDFAAWQRRALRDGSLSAQQAFWQRQLANAPGPLLPLDRPRAAAVARRAARRGFTFARTTGAALNAFARREGVTAFATVLAAVKGLLARCSGREDILVGTSIANRSRPELEPLIGYVAHALALRTNLSGDPSFRELVGRVRDVTISAFANPDVPYEQLDAGRRPAGAPPPPLFEVLLILHGRSASTPPPELPGLRLELLDVPELPPQYGSAMADLAFLMREDEAGLSGVLEYAAELFDPSTIDRLLRQLDALLESALAAPEERLSRLSLGEDVMPARAPAARGMDFSLFYFGNDDDTPGRARYQLLLDGARFADARGFSAVWTPERHFHVFGGPYPNAATTTAALALVTERIQLRAGSVVLPLHDSLRVAEDWSVIDNLSNGRAGISFASGWNTNDFVFAPERFADRPEALRRGLDEVRRLWRGESVKRRNGNGAEVEISIHPRPVQPELPSWVTAVGNPETFRFAGRVGAGLLTNLLGLGQDVEELSRKIQLYREAWREAGHSRGRGHVALMLHTYVASTHDAVHRHARAPLARYLRSSVELFNGLIASQGLALDVQSLSPADIDALLEQGVTRYLERGGLFGTPESCLARVEQLRALDVDEIACLIDFGISHEATMEGLEHLDELRRRSQAPASARRPTVPPRAARPPAPAPLPSSEAPIARARRELPLPLSFAQQRLWYVAQLEPGAVAYNVPIALRVSGALDAAALQGSLDALVQRHEVLRTTYHLEDAGVRQVIAPGLSIPLRRVEPGAELSRTMAEELAVPFDLARGPVLRATLYRLGATEHVLLLVLHHIAMDGWSATVLCRDLGALYAARLGHPAPLPELSVQYADYAAWQREAGNGPELEAQLAYWKQRLAGLTAVELPADRPRPAHPTGRGASVPVHLPPALAQGLKALGKREGATLYMVLVAGLQALIQRFTGQTDVAIGSPIASRPRSELEHLIGCFLNTLVMRGDLSGAPSFRALIGRARETALGAYAHQELPFERMVEALEVPREHRRAPFFQVMFTLQNVPAAELRAPGLILRPYPLESQAAKFDLTLELTDAPEGLGGTLEYSTELFDAGTVQALLRHLRALLEAAVAEPDRPLAELSLLDAPERQRVLREWNDTGADFPEDATLAQLFEAQVARTPDAVALRLGEASLSFRALNAWANQVAHRLRALGVRPEHRVGIFMERTLERMAALLGVLKAGAAWLPLEPTHPRERLALLLEDSGARLVLAQVSLEELLPRTRARVLAVDPGLASFALERAENPPSLATPDNAAYVLYTSGSTGMPKGVVAPHRGTVNRFWWMYRAYAFRPGEVCCQKTAFSFGDSVWEMLGPLLAGVPSVLIPDEDARDPHRLVEQLAAAGVTRWVLVPSLLQTLLDVEPALARRLPRLRLWVTSGERLPPALARRFLELLPAATLLNLYGASELAADATFEEVSAEAVTIGQPISNMRAYVLDAALRPLAPGLRGELYLGGVGLARGYLGRPELTAERFVPDPFASEPGARMYRPGDGARFLPDGRIDYLGRTDFQVKLRGFRIELGEVEAVLARHPGVRAAVAAVREDGPGGSALVGYAEPAPGATLDGAALRRFAQEQLPGYMVPASVVVLSALPRTPGGKVNRQALPAPERTARVEGASAEPSTPMEQALAAIWAELLELPKVGRQDDFFALGGHSLLATRLAARVHSTLGVEMSLKELFEAPTVARLAERLAPRSKSGPGERFAEPSFSQERLWFLEQLEPGTALYNIPAALRLEGAIDVGALRQSLDALVHRHESLRTSFAAQEGRPVQVLSPPAPVEMPLIDLSALPVAEREAEARRRMEEEGRQPFVLSRGPLLRVALLRLSEKEHLLLLTMHHIISDGWSTGVLVRELGALYMAFRAGRTAALPPLPIQYPDYAAEQRRRLRGAALEEQVAWWRRELAGAPAALELPTEHPRPASSSYRGEQLPFELSPETMSALRGFCRAEGVTPFMALLAAFSALLSRISGQEDVCVGSPVAGRSRPELEGLIGFFVSTLVFRVRAHGDPTFRELAHRARTSALGALEHAELPFEKLVEAIQPERQPGRTPLFQVALVLVNTPMPALALPGLAMKLLHVETGTSKFDLTLSFTESPAGLTGYFEYRTELFSTAAAQRLLKRFLALLDAALVRPALRLGELPLVDEEERRRVLVEWNATAAELPRACLSTLFEEQAARAPDAPALEFEGTRLTYRELDARANRLAHQLVSRGVRPGEAVGLCTERSLELVVGLLAILKAGAAYVPLDPSYPRERLGFMLEDLRLRHLVAQPHLVERVPAHGAAVLLLEAGGGADGLPTPPPVPLDPEGLAFVLYTSGSTGRPKGVALPHRAGVRAALGIPARFGADEVVLQLSPLAFDASTFEIWGCLLHGGKLVVMPPQVPSLEELGQALSRHGVTTLFLTTPLFEQMVVHQPEALSRVRQVLAGGDVMPPGRARELLSRGGVRLINGYGPTENATFTTCHAMETPEQVGPSSVPIGRPVANTRVYVLDAALRPLPQGVPGELYTSGEGLAWGYLEQPALTAERFLPDPFSPTPGARMYRTGDLARHLADGELQFLGRRDDQVKIRGFRVELGEVEAALSEHPGLEAAAVTARPDESGGKRLWAYYVPREGAAVTAESLRAFLRARLPEHLVPATFFRLEALPLAPTGKVDRRALPVLDPAAAREGRPAVAPRTATEEKVAALWRKVLGLAEVGVTDSFFELGGHSLLATQLLAHLEAELGVTLPLRSLFEGPTVAELAKRLDASPRGRASRAPPLVPASREAPLPLSFSQERLWNLFLRDPASTAYNMPFPLRLSGTLDAGAMERALQALVARHESLRTTFGEHAGRPAQRVVPGVALPVPRVDLRGHPDRQAEALRRVQADAQQPFDLRGNQLVRAELLRLEETEHILIFSMHHILSDGWSTGVLVQELGRLYAAFVRGGEPGLPPLAIQYPDYAAWLRGWLDGAELEARLGYWREALRGAPLLLELPLDHPRPPQRTFNGVCLEVELGVSRSTAINALCQAEHVTPFMALLAAFGAVLCHHSRQEEVILGSPIANRILPELEPLIGLFVNGLALRVNLRGNPGFRELLGRVREVTLGAYAHQEVPFEQVVDALGVERRPDRTPVFQAMFALQNAPLKPLELPGLALQLLTADRGASIYELTLSLSEGPQGFHGELEFNTDLFAHARMERLLADVLRLLDAVLARPEQPVGLESGILPG